MSDTPSLLSSRGRQLSAGIVPTPTGSSRTIAGAFPSSSGDARHVTMEPERKGWGAEPPQPPCPQPERSSRRPDWTLTFESFARDGWADLCYAVG